MNLLNLRNRKPMADPLPSAERAASMLRERILSGQLPPGTALREISLAADIEISRNTLREALRQLAAEGLIEQKLYKGAAVRTITPEEVRDIYVVRRALEQHAIEDSAIAPQEKFAALEKAVANAELAARAGQWQEAGTASLRFHQAVVALLGSDRLNQFFKIILAQLRLAFSEARSEASFQKSWITRDREISELLCAGKRQEASQAMRIYLADSERIVLDMVRATRRR